MEIMPITWGGRLRHCQTLGGVQYPSQQIISRTARLLCKASLSKFERQCKLGNSLSWKIFHNKNKKRRNCDQWNNGRNGDAMEWKPMARAGKLAAGSSLSVRSKCANCDILIIVTVNWGSPRRHDAEQGNRKRRKQNAQRPSPATTTQYVISYGRKIARNRP